VFQGAQYDGGAQNTLEFIRTSGGDVLDKDGHVIVGAAAALQGLTTQRSMVTSGTSPAAVAEYKEDESGGAFLSGDSVFLRSWGYLYGLVSDPTQSKLTDAQVGVAELPVAASSIPRVNVGGGWNLFMNANGHNKDLAWALMQFISAAPQQKVWAIQGSLLPTLVAVYADPAVQKAMPVVTEGATVVPETTTPPKSRYYADMSLAMARHFNASLRGAETPEQAATALQSELSAIVDKS
jgi:multiple sugar transport system substrate-binding protein